MYLRAIENAGGEPIEISLRLSPEELDRQLQPLDAIVLPGSPADIEPGRYGAARHPESAAADPSREEIDRALLDLAFKEHVPVLAICYGLQSLNVYLGGTLIQDIASELGTKIQHPWSDKKGPEPLHRARLEPNSRVAELAGAAEVEVNSSHHQSIREPGRGLRVAARAPDGVIEAAEWTGAADWVTAVQWHPERRTEDFLARALFRELVAAARGAHAKI